MRRLENVEGTRPKTLKIGRTYHITGLKTGAQFILKTIEDNTATLYTPKKLQEITVDINRLRNTYRNREK